MARKTGHSVGKLAAEVARDLAASEAATGSGALRSPQTFKQTFSSLGQPAYRYLWIGMLLQMGAMQMQMLTRGFFIFELTNSPTLLGVVTGSAAVPALAFGLFGGVLADRLDKRRLIQTGQAISMLMALFVAALTTAGMITWQHLLIASVGQGAVMAMMMPTRQAIVPQIVRKELLANAIALNSLGMSLIMMTAPAIAGILIPVIGIEGVYYVMAGLYAGAIVFTGLLPRTQQNEQVGKASILTDLVEGVQYVRRRIQILLLLLLAFSTMLFSMPLMAILPVFAKEVFEVGSQGLGALVSAMGVGSLMGALAVAALSQGNARGLLLLRASLVTGGVLLGFALMAHFSPTYWAGLVMLAIIGGLMSVRMTLNNTLVLEATDPQFRGRVMSLFSLSFGLMPAAVLPLGILTNAVGAPLALTAMAGCLLAAVGAIIVVSYPLRQLR